MPYSATVEDIMNFLGELSLYILPNGIHMVLNQQVRESENGGLKCHDYAFLNSNR